MKKIFLLDMDGTIYHEDKLIEGTLEFFSYLNKNKIKYIFITNNSSKSVSTYIEKLTSLGISCDSTNFYTSIDASIDYLKSKKAHTIYTVGTHEFDNAMQEEFTIDKVSKFVPYVLLGFDTELTYDKIRRACELIDNGSIFLATNIDEKCPIIDNRFIPDCGAIAKLITTATNKNPIFLGKPNPIIVENILSKELIDKKDAIVIGDRLYTDILLGVNAEVDSIAVLTGETTKEEIADSPYKPTYTCDSILDVLSMMKKGEI